MPVRQSGPHGGDTNAKATRDKAFTYMKMAVDEIRNTGQYVVWHDEERRKVYVSQYLKRTRDRLKNNKQKDETTAEKNLVVAQFYRDCCLIVHQ